MMLVAVLIITAVLPHAAGHSLSTTDVTEAGTLDSSLGNQTCPLQPTSTSHTAERYACPPKPKGCEMNAGRNGCAHSSPAYQDCITSVTLAEAVRGADDSLRLLRDVWAAKKERFPCKDSSLKKLASEAAALMTGQGCPTILHGSPPPKKFAMDAIRGTGLFEKCQCCNDAQKGKEL
mmetsp:Transcript_19619/g.47539  ORF Transcript_19619/g.47539 Transcript_19619/m.47539 type:complete len:177 (+) Transcript_19619:760-1290(+)